MSSTPVENALFDPILQCISRNTATRLVLFMTITIAISGLEYSYVGAFPPNSTICHLCAV